jgi:hypothetical protein
MTILKCLKAIQVHYNIKNSQSKSQQKKKLNMVIDQRFLRKCKKNKKD